MGTATLRVLVQVLVVAAGIVGRANYGQVVEPSTTAFAQNVLNCEDFNPQAEAQAAQRTWWRKVFGL
jgi:hypothetical protein